MPTTPGKSKTMSSRLLTMKFMQRAAASTSTSSPAAEDPETPSPKRQRLSTSSRPETPNSDLAAVHAAIAAEEQKRAEAVARQAAEAGESNWVLDFSTPASSSSSSSSSVAGVVNYPSQPMIIPAGSLDAEDQGMEVGGRKSYGNFKSKNRRNMFENPEDEDLNSEQQKAIKEKARRKAEREERKRDANLSGLTSLSGRGGSFTPDRSNGNGKKKHKGKSGKKRSK